MRNLIFKDKIAESTNCLENHPLYESITSIDDLRCFTEHHIYSVWDFMSLLKCLQAMLAPANYPWLPDDKGFVKRFINELVLEEESDASDAPHQFTSHCQLYIKGMEEIGADLSPFKQFLQAVNEHGITEALSLPCIPKASRNFTSKTFEFIDTNQFHKVAAAFAFGREHIIPRMFRSILEKINISERDAPIFHYYIKRHIHLDGESHASKSLELLNELCDNSACKVEEAIHIAREAVKARLFLWDEVYEESTSS